MKYIYALLLLGTTFLLSACDSDDPELPGEKKSRTVLAYMMADNSLSGLAGPDIEEMVQGMQ
ncbi:MAG: hypothetical protein LUE99_19165 [Bacteroides sp.]|nr:hypothetical protein [Bacteroides sp.]